MNDYFTALASSELPFGTSALAIAWLVLFAANHQVARASWRRLAAQTHVVLADSGSGARGLTPLALAVQAGYAALVFGIGWALGATAFAFFAGGLTAALAVTLGLNVHSLAFARLLARDDAGTGTATLSARFTLRNTAWRALGGACALVLLGLLLAHLAPLGGALFLTASASGMLRRARRL